MRNVADGSFLLSLPHCDLKDRKAWLFQMIQDIKEIYHNEYKEQKPENGDYCMFVKGRSVLVKRHDDQIVFLTYGEIDSYVKEDEFVYLFSVGEKAELKKYFLYMGDTLEPETVFENYSYENQNIFRIAKPKEQAFAGITACQLANWYKNTRYCGHCGSKLVHDHKERMMRCPCCNAMHYPKISPAVIIALTDKNRILMTKYAGRDYKKYALIAGFTEIGETLEETVQREVMEEVGLKVKNIRYYKSQPWSFSDTILMGFFCELDGEDRICMDEEELSVAEWVSREDMTVTFDDVSLTNEMMMAFKNKKVN